jgi:raffinose/stachyose/melibiose transport system permease protein
MGPVVTVPTSKLRNFLGRIGSHFILIPAALVALFPIVLVVMNSLKSRKAIFGSPLVPPLPGTFSLVGYQTVLKRSNFDAYFLNSLIVTVGAMFLILFLGSMAAFALSEYKFPGNTVLGLYMAIGIMIPIRLGTVSILRLAVSLKIVNTLAALILVYTAMGLPLTIFILQQFFRQVPKDLKDAARVDGASEYYVYRLALPLVAPAVATVAVFTMMPIWNDLWFPLILAPSDATKTVTLGTQQFLGQFVTDWNAVLSSLTLAMLPVLILYLLFSRQLTRGLTAGALK